MILVSTNSIALHAVTVEMSRLVVLAVVVIGQVSSGERHGVCHVGLTTCAGVSFRGDAVVVVFGAWEAAGGGLVGDPRGDAPPCGCRGCMGRGCCCG
mmetsp:Transcript_16074/g.33259  ORF Transcript_16074/g.33259 Transcript_16074/m.33259 type:complete len:97 (-) Transcript_16074:2225-2515(-)